MTGKLLRMFFIETIRGLIHDWDFGFRMKRGQRKIRQLSKVPGLDEETRQAAIALQKRQMESEAERYIVTNL